MVLEKLRTMCEDPAIGEVVQLRKRKVGQGSHKVILKEGM
jgi:hypothetical protein